MNVYTSTVACDRCHLRLPDTQAVGGCPDCGAEGVPVNLRTQFKPYDPIAARDTAQPGLFAWRAGYPLTTDAEPVSLGEGNTAVVPLPHEAERLGVAAVTVKDESRNPTWSYKDRLAAVAVTRAKADGADTVIVATTGNHGAAVAAYAAAAGLRCVILTASTASPVMLAQMLSYGAHVVALPTSGDRWTVMDEAVDQHGWFPISGFHSPPVGSTPLGIDGYKSISFELYGQLLGSAPDLIVVPTAYGDGLAGIHRGFTELHAAGRIAHMPRMVAAEPLGPVANALQTGSGDVLPALQRRPTVAFSIGNPVSTYQALHSVRATGGSAEAPFSDEEILAAQRRIAAVSGIFPETASAISWATLDRMRDSGRLAPDDHIVVVNTSTGIKTLPESGLVVSSAGIPVIEPTLAALDRAL